MGLRERVLEAAGIPTAEDVQERVDKAFERGFFEAFSTSPNDDPAQGDFRAGGLGYRKMSDRYVREGKIDFGKAVEVAWRLWQKSPVAKRVLNMKRDHIIGHAATPSADDDDLQEILDEFWLGNKLDDRASQFTGQLFGFGEQIFPAFVREADGRVRLGYIDPQSVEMVIKHPENTMEDWAVVAQKQERGAYTTEKLVYRIIREDEDFTDGEAVTPASNDGKLVTWQQATLQDWEAAILSEYDRTEYDGSCFYYKVNSVSNQSRGMSDLLQVGDWIEQADTVLFSLADRERMASYFVFDVTVDGDDELVRRRSDYYRLNQPKSGSVIVHNQSEIVTMTTPDLKQTGSIETFRAVLGLILGGMGFPVHWFGYGDDANRATATVQADPTSKSLEHDQGLVRDMFLQMCQFAADQAEIAGSWTPDADGYDITLQLPEVQSRDLSRVTTSMQAATISLINAMDAGWITQDTAAEVFAKLLGELDIQVDPAAEVEEAAKADEEADLDMVNRTNGQLQQAMAMAGDAMMATDGDES
jgi:hypothetical protein